MAKKPEQKTTDKPADEQGQTPGQTEQAQEAPKGAKLTPVTKVTVKTVYGTIDQKKLPPLRVNLSDANPEGEPNPNPDFYVCRIVGYATGVKRGDSSYGPWAALTGEFAATNAETGEIFAGKTAIIPGAMGDALVTSAEKALSDDATSQVKFSCDVYARRSARDPNRKYEYVVRPVIDAKLSSPALELLALEA